MTIKTILPTSPVYQYRGFAQLQLTSHRAVGTRHPFNSQHALDNPNASVCFCTDAASFSLGLHFVDKADMPGRVDFAGQTIVLCDNRPLASITRPGDQGGSVWTTISQSSGVLRTYEIALSYADNVAFLGLQLDAQASFQAVPIPLRPLYIAYGDSITQGFHAADSTANYPRKIAITQQWNLLNLGFGSHQATAADAETILAHQPDYLSVLIGINDCYKKVPPEHFTDQYRRFLKRLASYPTLSRLFIMTPLAVPNPDWGIAPEGIEQYRQIIRGLVGELPRCPITLIEGTSLLSDAASLYQDGLHPNDAGFAVLADNLNRAITQALAQNL